MLGSLKKNYRVAPEVKEQIIKRVKEEGIPVAQDAKEHGIHESTVYG
jgi:transposase-like protein